MGQGAEGDRARSSELESAADLSTRRRLAWLAGIAGGVLVATGLIHYATDFGNSSTQLQPGLFTTSYSSAQQQQQQQLGDGALNLGIAYGTTPKQVLRRLGSPTTKQARCWIYRGPTKIPGSYRALYVDAAKFCFSAGAAGGKAVTQIFNHTPTHTIIKENPVTHTVTKEKFSAQWGPEFVLQRPPDWYLQQSS